MPVDYARVDRDRDVLCWGHDPVCRSEVEAGDERTTVVARGSVDDRLRRRPPRGLADGDRHPAHWLDTVVRVGSIVPAELVVAVPAAD